MLLHHNVELWEGRFSLTMRRSKSHPAKHPTAVKDFCIAAKVDNLTTSSTVSESSVIDVIKPMRCYAVRFTPYAASGGVKLTCVITMLDAFLRL